MGERGEQEGCCEGRVGDVRHSRATLQTAMNARIATCADETSRENVRTRTRSLHAHDEGMSSARRGESRQ